MNGAGYGRIFICTLYRGTEGRRADLFFREPGRTALDGSKRWKTGTVFAYRRVRRARSVSGKNPLNGRYYLIATDLRIEKGEGWQAAQERGSRDIIIWESEDLIHWEKERAHTVGIREAGCVWAPEAVFDEEEQAFLVFLHPK